MTSTRIIQMMDLFECNYTRLVKEAFRVINKHIYSDGRPDLAGVLPAKPVVCVHESEPLMHLAPLAEADHDGECVAVLRQPHELRHHNQWGQRGGTVLPRYNHHCHISLHCIRVDSAARISNSSVLQRLQ